MLSGQGVSEERELAVYHPITHPTRRPVPEVRAGAWRIEEIRGQGVGRQPRLADNAIQVRGACLCRHVAPLEQRLAGGIEPNGGLVGAARWILEAELQCRASVKLYPSNGAGTPG